VEHQTNVAATVSLAAGIATVVLMVVHLCMSVVPFVSMCALLVYPLHFLSAIVALVSGIVGYRAAALMEDVGKSASVTGVAISICYFVFQLVVCGLGLMVGGLAALVSVIGG
jgi:hypothetical protein